MIKAQPFLKCVRDKREQGFCRARASLDIARQLSDGGGLLAVSSGGGMVTVEGVRRLGTGGGDRQDRPEVQLHTNSYHLDFIPPPKQGEPVTLGTF